jgi:geranylgeranyl diphosphate synthase, type I
MNFQETIAHYKKIIDEELNIFFDKKIEEIDSLFIKQNYEFLKEYITTGGKRLRSISTIMSYIAFGGKDVKKIIPASLAVELQHAYSLILDDIMDEDMYRRNNPGLNKKLKDYYLENFKDINYDGELFSKTSTKYAVSYGMMLGSITDLLCKKLLLEMDENDEIKNKCAKIIVDNNLTIFHGQMLDVHMEIEKEVSINDYMQMISRKTSPFFYGALGIGAMLAGATDEDLRKIKEFGLFSSMAFQIQDDIIDINSDMDKGNTFASDIIKGKRTLIVIHCLENSTDEKQNELIKILDKNNNSDEEIEKAISILNESDSIDYAKKVAQEYLEKSQTALEKINMSNEGKKFFSDLSEFMINRKY